jgi:hypothetical protein
MLCGFTRSAYRLGVYVFRRPANSDTILADFGTCEKREKIDLIQGAEKGGEAVRTAGAVWQRTVSGY